MQVGSGCYDVAMSNTRHVNAIFHCMICDLFKPKIHIYIYIIQFHDAIMMHIFLTPCIIYVYTYHIYVYNHIFSFMIWLQDMYICTYE